MTRINVVPVETLCNQHLLAEHRELTRIPNTIVSGKAKLDGKYPKEYTLGAGHVKFFYPHLKWLHNRYNQLYQECLYRGFNVKYIWPDNVPTRLYNDWEVTQEAIDTNLERIKLRLPANAKFTKREVKE